VPKKVNKKKAEQKIKDALNILTALGLPRQQLNERSALTLLSLLALEPESKWAEASDPLMGITPMMDFFPNITGKSMRRIPAKRYDVKLFINFCRPR